MIKPNPPQNYNVNVVDGEKILSFTTDTDVIRTKIKIFNLSNILFEGTTTSDSIKVPITISGYNEVEGESENNEGGWGEKNNPPVSVNFY